MNDGQAVAMVGVGLNFWRGWGPQPAVVRSSTT
jgi:hypothetical protein